MTTIEKINELKSVGINEMVESLTHMWAEINDYAEGIVRESYGVEEGESLEWDWVNNEIIRLLEDTLGKDIFRFIQYDTDGSFEVVYKGDQVKTMSQFCEWLNRQGEWTREADEIIERNGWQDDADKPFGVCSGSEGRIELNEDGYVYYDEHGGRW